MWPFKRKKKTPELATGVNACPYCGSTDTHARSTDMSEEGSYVKTWRGQRYVTFNCRNCGRDFYLEESDDTDQAISEHGMIDDEDELRAAEEELRRQADDEGDHMYRSGL